MNKTKKLAIVLILIVLMILGNKSVYANDIINYIQKEEYTEEFKKWLELSDEEKEKVIMPRMYDVPYRKKETNNILPKLRMAKASNDVRYSLKDIIPANMIIKNQQNTGSCWAFAGLSSLETNLALRDYKNGITTNPKVYDYSERHMEYATSRTFKNGQINPIGYNREVGDGGWYLLVSSYLVNGYGAVEENDMPFLNNENKINLSEIQGKTIASQVQDTIEFPDYNELSGNDRLDVINRVKEHIQNYGSVDASIHGDSARSLDGICYNSQTGGLYCNNSETHPADHNVAIIGWMDNYSKENFSSNSKPTSHGAWIVRNSWGGSFGEEGLIYVSYEDVNISSMLFGIIKANDEVDYDKIYQYDELYPIQYIRMGIKKYLLINEFDKESNNIEYLTQVGIYSPDEYTYKVYVNSTDGDKVRDKFQLVTLKTGESETLGCGYHILEFAKAIELTGNKFAVMIEIENKNLNDEFSYLQVEGKRDGVSQFDFVDTEENKCFYGIDTSFDNNDWVDLGKLSQIDSSFPNCDSSIKAYTVNELNDGSLKDIKITHGPDRVNYIEGEDFDPTGMIVTAYYNSKENPSAILNSSQYTILDGTNLKLNQTGVKIKVEDKEKTQVISVEKNIVTDLKIKSAPDKITYYEGEDFDPDGMIVEATFKRGNKQIITDYELEDNENLNVNQTYITIKYENVTKNQLITVLPNHMVGIEIANSPRKVEYIVGQNFDPLEMIVKVRYENGDKREITDYTLENNTNLLLGQTKVLVKYQGFEAEQIITVENKKVTNILINKNPDKTQYIQNKEELNLTGGKLKVEYNDRTSELIDLTSNLISVSGFDNTKIGNINIIVEYEGKTTTFKIEIVKDLEPEPQPEPQPGPNPEPQPESQPEPVVDEKPVNSNFEKASSKINELNYYSYTNKQDYFNMDIIINGIMKSNKNDSCEYYYYISSNKNETNIKNWVKIENGEIKNNSLQIKVDSKKLSNVDELEDASEIYIYIKEVAVLGKNKSEKIFNAIEIKGDSQTVGTYYENDKKVFEIKGDDIVVEGKKTEIIPVTTSEKTEGDTTIKGGTLPATGMKTMLVLIGIVFLVGIVIGIRYRNLKKYVK